MAEIRGGSELVQAEADGRGPPTPPAFQGFHNCCPTCGGRLGSDKTLLTIMQEVSEKHNVPVREIRGSRVFPRISEARKEYFVRAYFETTQSMKAIARFAGDRDHSCVHHAVKMAKRKFNRRMKESA